MKFQYLLALVALLGATAMFITPDLVSAQGPATLVPCGTDENPDECTVCHLVALGQNIMNFFVFASVVVATLLFVNAGVLYVFSPGNPGNISRGHKIFTNTLVGILIILSSWILIDFVMRQLVKPELLQSGAPGQANRWGPWNNILCAPGPRGPEAPELQGTPGVVVVPDAGGPAAGASAVTEAVARDWVSNFAHVNANPPQTTLVGVQEHTLRAIQTMSGSMQQMTGLTAQQLIDQNLFMVTGGTESGMGHTETGGYDHASGYKLDFHPTSAMDEWVARTLPNNVGVRSSDGATMYEGTVNGRRTQCAREDNHWDCTFF